MPPPVSRELSITYAGVTVGGVSDYYLTDKYNTSDAYEKTTVGFVAVIRGTTEASFGDACIAVEAAFRTPRGDLTIVQGVKMLKALSHAGSTGFNAVPSITKEGADFDNGHARRYKISIDFERPADLAGQNGRRDSTMAIHTIEGGRRTMTISGRYTAIGGTTARAKYEANVDAFVTAYQPAGVWRFVDKNASTDDTNKNCQFTHTYQEILNSGRLRSQILLRYEPGRRRILTITGTYTATIAQPSSRANYLASVPAFLVAVLAGIDPAAGAWALVGESFQQDDLDQNTDFTREYEELVGGELDRPSPNLAKHTLTISKEIAQPGDSAGRVDVKRLVTIRVEFTGWVNVETGPFAAIEYESTIRPWIVSRVLQTYELGQAALVSESVHPNPLTGYISASMVFQVATVGQGGLLEYRITVDVSDQTGRRTVPVWNRTVYDAVVFSAPAQRIRTIREHSRVLYVAGQVADIENRPGAVDIFESLKKPGESLAPGSIAGWVRMDGSITETPLKLGTAEFPLYVMDRDSVLRQQWVGATPIPPAPLMGR